MAKDSDKKRQLDDDNESLVKALESINALLATSESKLNKARESIDQASSFAIKNDNDVPVLEDIVVPGKMAKIPELPEISETSPAQNSETPEQAEEQQPAPTTSPGPDAESLALLKMELENEMHEKLISYAAQLEEDLKAKIQIYLEQRLRQGK